MPSAFRRLQPRHRTKRRGLFSSDRSARRLGSRNHTALVGRLLATARVVKHEANDHRREDDSAEDVSIVSAQRRFGAWRTLLRHANARSKRPRCPAGAMPPGQGFPVPPGTTNYLPRAASFRPPNVLRTLPFTCSPLPSASVFLSPVALPAHSFTLPLACSAEPLMRSLSTMSVSFSKLERLGLWRGSGRAATSQTPAETPAAGYSLRRLRASCPACSTAFAMISPALRAKPRWSIGARPEQLLCCRCRAGSGGDLFARTDSPLVRPCPPEINVDFPSLVPRNPAFPDLRAVHSRRLPESPIS